MGERGEVGAMKEDVSLNSKNLQGKTQGAVLFVIRVFGVTVAKVEVRRNVAYGLGSESKKCELVVGGT